MKPTLKPRVKICCIKNKEEAQQAIDLGASALGLVGDMPSGPGIISDDMILEVSQFIPPPIASFLLTSHTDVDAIIAHHQKVQTNTIQIVDELKTGTYAQLRKALPTVWLVQVVHVIDETTIDYALKVAQEVDALLLDSGNPNAKIKTLGGTGNTHNWEISRQIREKSPIPVFLAGGLKPDNIAQAIEKVAPFGVDLCSGVRTDGNLDTSKLKRFFAAMN